jgi:hypothetical protein
LRCGVWYDPARPHICGVMGDDTAKRLEELIFENRSRIEALDRRLLEIEATRSHDPAISPAQAEPIECATGTEAPRAPAPLTLAELRSEAPIKQPLDRKRYHAGYMRRWRARRKALLKGNDIG